LDELQLIQKITAKMRNNVFSGYFLAENIPREKHFSFSVNNHLLTFPFFFLKTVI